MRRAKGVLRRGLVTPLGSCLPNPWDGSFLAEKFVTAVRESAEEEGIQGWDRFAARSRDD